MWSAFSKDLSEFAQNFKAESKGLMDMMGQLASDVVGHGGVYAGDEFTAEAKATPLDNPRLLTFQENNETYLAPFTTEEKDGFDGWSTTCVFSSYNVQRRRADATAPTTTTDDSAGDADMTTPAKSTEWPDEPTDETRQRLLDYSEVVLQKYTELVGEAVSPRTQTSSQVTPARTPAAAPAEGEEATTPQRPSPAEDPAGTPVTTTAEAAGATTPTPRRVPPSSGVLSEDVFFDRYFYRLHRLRATVAEERRVMEAERQQAKEQEQRERQEAQAAKEREEKERKAAAAAAGSAEGSGTGKHVPVRPPVFVKNVLTVASELVANLDVALGGSKETEEDNAHNVPLSAVADGSYQSSALPPTREEWEGQLQKSAGLEAVVQELQEELRKERARVRQLTTLLEDKGLTVPPSPALTPARSEKPLEVHTETKKEEEKEAAVTEAAKEEEAPVAATTEEVQPEQESPVPESAGTVDTEDEGWVRVSPPTTS